MTHEDPRDSNFNAMIQGACPRCGREGVLRKGTIREATLIRNAPIEIEAEVQRCDDCGEVFATVHEEQRNFEKAYRIYRDQHGLLQPEEIRDIRKQYRLGQRAFSRLLGWGELTLHR